MLKRELYCRACLKESLEFIEVFKLCNCFNLSIAQMLMECCQIKIKNDDDDKNVGGSMICIMCLKLLHISYEFKLNCQKAQQLLNNQTQINQQIPIINVQEEEYLDLTKHETKVVTGNLKENKDPKPQNKSSRSKVQKRKKCDKCEKTFRDQEQLNNHFIVHHQTDKPKIQCPICPKMFSLKGYLNQHIRTVHEHKKPIKRKRREESINCQLCDKNFNDNRSLKRHFLTQHLNKKPQIQCTACTKCFTQKGNLNRHIRTCHQNQRLFKCDICNKTFTTKFAQSHHKQTVCKISENDEGMDEGITRGEVGVCSLCNIKVYSHNLDKHLDKHNDPFVQKFSCDLCQFQFVCQNDLKYHELWKHGDKMKKRSHLCSICGKAFVQEYHLRDHIAMHTKTRSHKCNICGKSFVFHSNYSTHLRIHTNTRNYRCDYCEKTFIQSTQLKAHVRKHTGEQPYSCDFCERKFSRKTNRDAHRRIHTGEKPYECTMCENKFYSAGKLSTHKRKKH